MAKDMHTLAKVEVTIDEIKSIVQTMFENSTTREKAIAVWGAPGIGKTEFFEQVAKANNAKYKVFLTATMDPTDVNGVPFPIDGFTKFLAPEGFMELTEHPNVSYKGPMIACFDDLPACPEQVFAALFRMFRNREVGGYKIRDNVLLCATGNRVEDRAGASEIPTALANRFVHFTLKVDKDQWINWAIQNKVHPLVITYIREVGVTALHNFKPEASSQMAFVTPRSVDTASSLVHAFGVENKNLQVSLAGTCGEAWAFEFMNFSKIKDKIVPADEIFENPNKARVPAKTNIDGALATCTNLACEVAARGTTAAFIAAAEYAVRLHHKDMGAMLAMDLTKILTSNANIQQDIYSDANKDVITKWQVFVDLFTPKD